MRVRPFRAGVLIVVGFAPLMATIMACAITQPEVVYVTATPALTPIPTLDGGLPNPFRPTPTPNQPTAIPIQPTPNPTVQPTRAVIEYTIQAGDTLSGLAFLYGIDLPELLALNAGLTETTPLIIGQRLYLPATPAQMTPNMKLIPDSELVNSPAARGFDVAAYVKYQPGFIRVYSEEVSGRYLSGAEIIAFHARAASVNPRLLLALLEYRGGWLTNPIPRGDAFTYPMGHKDERLAGLFNQVAWAVNQLNEGYYGWRTRGFRALELPDKGRLAFAPDLNGGTVGVQYFLARTARDRAGWLRDVSTAGFFTTYLSMFGDPFALAIEPLVPPELRQPDFLFPFPPGETWFLTSGPHGGWDARATGWSAADIAPPAPPDEVIFTQGYCYVSPNWTTAMAAGVVVRSDDGVVIIDLDMDGDERTGWTLVYLHVAAFERVPAGKIVQVGERIGHPSCEGFFLNSIATHAHVSRRYNGEWIVADCFACLPGVAAPPFVMSGWTLKSDRIVYDGSLQKEGQIRRAMQGRDDPANQISW